MTPRRKRDRMSDYQERAKRLRQRKITARQIRQEERAKKEAWRKHLLNGLFELKTIRIG